MDIQQVPPRYSAIVPVYNSEQIVAKTIDRTVQFFEDQGWTYEIILVNDGSRDNSWHVISKKAQENPHVIAINLLRNYGQHTAIFCGLQHSRGDYIVTLDDDLQNPPEEIVHLVQKAEEGHDAVFGRFHQKKHNLSRRLGSNLIAQVNVRIFGKPAWLSATNFRLFSRDVTDRICAYRTAYPYITGLVLMHSSQPANADVEHREREVGRSNYTLRRILELVMRIVFNYSSYPLRVLTAVGGLTAVVGILIGVYYILRALLVGISVPGWTTLVVLFSFFNGLNLLITSMLGEYVMRLLQQSSASTIYYVKEIVREQE
jgi:glycosyltransferase involved in cell wall biosynthesis